MDGPPEIMEFESVEYDNLHDMYNAVYAPIDDNIIDPFTNLQDRRAENQNPDITYALQITIEMPNDIVVIADDVTDVMRHIRNMNDIVSNEITDLLKPDSPYPVKATLVRTTRHPGLGPGFAFAANPRSRFWGPLGKVNNCVIKQISSRVEGYLVCGARRSYMWSSDGIKYSTDRLHPDYNSAASKRLATDKVYIKIKAGVCAFLSRRDSRFSDAFGFDPRDLCELAELCSIRVMVWMRSRVTPVLRWDTNALVSESSSLTYTFHFWMSNHQHLEMCDASEITRNLDESIAWNGGFRNDKVSVKYVNSEWFNSVITTGFAPEQPFRPNIFTIARQCLRWPLPESYARYKHSDMLLLEGNTMYKHECCATWLDSKNLDPDDPKYANVLCDADLHFDRLIIGMRHRNMLPIKQSVSPSLFEAVTRSDKVTTHTLMRDVSVGDVLWEVDGRKWYHTDFSKVPDFPYFHGIPAADTWSEYNCESSQPVCDPRTGLWSPLYSYVGNGEGDRPFTFTYGKYAIFLIESLCFDKCDEHTIEHFTRDKLFVDMNPVMNHVCLTSPIVHFLQDLGVIWKARYVWVCYGVVDDWIVGETRESAALLRADMLEHKTYAISVGKLSSSSTIITSKHIVADGTTAADIAEWHSTRFVQGESNDNIFEGVHTRHSADAILIAEDADVYGATSISGSSFKKGLITKIIPTQDMDITKLPYLVHTHYDVFGYGSTRAHISGAIHSMCFIQLYRAALCMPPENIAGFGLDSIKCYNDPTGYIGRFISDSDDKAGSFKPVVTKLMTVAHKTSTSLLSQLYTPRVAFTGLSTPDKKNPLWGAYQDSLGQFNVITGPAGSGKTWRHLRTYGTVDNRIDKVLYAPLTNYLAAQLKSQGIRSITSFKAFNRRVMDSNTVGDANSRYNTDREETRNRLKGVACILRDEVTMDVADMLVDAIECCNAYHRQLLLVGDFDKDRFYQLSAVAGGGPDKMREALTIASANISPKQILWIDPQQVFRQAGDPELATLLDTLRHHEGDSIERWKCFENCTLFEHISYEEFKKRHNPVSDIVISPWHKIISELTEDILGEMDIEDELMLRGNFQSPYKTLEDDLPQIQRLAVFDDDPIAHKGVTVRISKRELEEMADTKFMNKGFPYDNTNMVNPMIGATVFALQGISLSPGSVLYVLINNPGSYEWLSDAQPCQAYVTASRIRTRNQLVFVRKDRNTIRRIS